MKNKIIILISLIIPSTLFAQMEWVQKHYIQYEDFRTFECLDSNNCYAFTDAVGSTIIYKSTDQGDTWFELYKKDHLATKDSLYKVFRCQALDTNNLYISYLDRLILDKSTDGGKSFKRITFDTLSVQYNADCFNAIKMYNNHIGVGTSNNFIITTSNNWETYKIIDKVDHKLAGGPIYFIDSNNVVLLKKYRLSDQFVKYSIYEDSWTDYTVSGNDNEEYPKVIADISFTSDSVAFACGGQKTGQNSLARDIIWKTTDKGIHWEIILEQEHEPVFGLNGITFKDKMNGMAVGAWGKILRTTNGGKSWNYMDIPESINNTISIKGGFAGQYMLIACQRSGILRYEDITDIEQKILDIEYIHIKQTADKLLISIEDKSFRDYKMQIFDIYGNIMNEIDLNSGIGILYNPIPLDSFINGVYLFQITTDGILVKSGKFILCR